MILARLNYWLLLPGKEEKSQLGDVLIMCNHPQRINDIIEVLYTMAGLGSKVHDVTFKYNIYFDECWGMLLLDLF